LEEIRKKWLLFASTATIVILLDQWSKYMVRTRWELQNLEIIPGWFSFLYTQNPGMALGIDIFDTFFISVVALIATIVIFVYIYRNVNEAPVPFMFLMGLVIGGAVGNLLDRMYMGLLEGYGGFLEGHVVDFLYFSLKINDWTVFPYIFNVADVAISLALILFLVFNKKFMPPEDKETAVIEEIVDPIAASDSTEK
jgi:signal peptidase II